MKRKQSLKSLEANGGQTTSAFRQFLKTLFNTCNLQETEKFIRSKRTTFYLFGEEMREKRENKPRRATKREGKQN